LLLRHHPHPFHSPVPPQPLLLLASLHPVPSYLYLPVLSTSVLDLSPPPVPPLVSSPVQPRPSLSSSRLPVRDKPIRRLLRSSYVPSRQSFPSQINLALYPYPLALLSFSSRYVHLAIPYLPTYAYSLSSPSHLRLRPVRPLLRRSVQVPYLIYSSPLPLLRYFLRQRLPRQIHHLQSHRQLSTPQQLPHRSGHRVYHPHFLSTLHLPH